MVEINEKKEDSEINKEKIAKHNETEENTGQKDVEKDNSIWKTVKGNKNISTQHQSVNIVEKVPNSDEEVLAKHKQSGHKRESPQSSPIGQTEQTIPVRHGNVCEECNYILKDTETMEIHTKKHEDKNNNFCDICQEDFENKYDFIMHNKNVHSSQWNCNQCDFQASTRQILLNHCKVALGHQPSKGQKQRMGQSGVMECYTCRAEFRSYHDLMNHRKEEHPSHKKCRYYIKEECVFSSEDCWYLHEDNAIGHTVQKGIENIECFVCKKPFSSKHDLLEHKKKNHPSKMICTKFQKGTCDRSAQECRYVHSKTAIKESSTESRSNAWDQPLSSLWQQDFQQTAPAPAPDQGALVKTLIMLNQRLESMEKIMFQKLI